MPLKNDLAGILKLRQPSAERCVVQIQIADLTNLVKAKAETLLKNDMFRL